MTFPRKVVLDAGDLRAVMPVKGSELISERAPSTASSDDVNIRTRIKANDMQKKNASHPPLLHNAVRWSTSVSEDSPLFIPPKATMPMTPRTTIIVP